MPTDANTGQPIFSHHASLYTRNRRPFGLTDVNAHPVAAKQSATAVTPVAAASLNDALNDGTLAENGYATGNARFLHLQIENDGTDDTLELYAYNYAFGSWAKLYLPHGSPANNVGDISEDDVVTQAAGTTNVAWVEAKWTTINGKFMVTIPIQGVDRIGFVHDGSLNDMVVRAACSTF